MKPSAAFRTFVLLSGAALLLAGQEPPQPPSLLVAGSPNPSYTGQLQADLAGLDPSQRPAFFKALRRQQREVRARIEEMTATLGQLRGLAATLARQDAGAAEEARRSGEAQAAAIQALKAMERSITQARLEGDAVTVDSDPLAADLYAGFQFSSLYRDPDQRSSFFAKSRPFVALDIRQTFRWPGRNRWIEGFGTLAFQSSSKEKSDTVDVITTSGNFRGEMGAWWMQGLTESVSWGVLASVGLVGYTEQEIGPDLKTVDRDQFHNRVRVGLTLRQEEGLLRGSVAEVAYVRDPLFVHQDRLAIRGKVLLTQFGSQGASGDFYMEGSVSKGRAGRDEAVLMLGLRLSTLAFFRSLGGGLAR